jgi:hypothetical protein
MWYTGVCAPVFFVSRFNERRALGSVVNGIVQLIGGRDETVDGIICCSDGDGFGVGC